VDDVPDGWVVLAEARIGLMAVPLDGDPPGADEHVYLHAVEYVDVDQIGNCAVVEERLTRLAPARPMPEHGATHASTTEDSTEGTGEHA
jgi:hypothetical protein